MTDGGLRGLEDDLSVPESRLTDEHEVSNLVTKMVDDDEKRSKVRSMVKGLFDGNPPYRQSELVKNGQAYRNNVNWRIAESFLTIGLTSYWDVITEGPSMATVTTDEGNPDQQAEWGRIITEEFQNFNLSDNALNYMFQTSQYHMLLYGIGPVIWEDELDYRARAIPNVIVPDGETSDLRDWEVAVVITDYSASRLYSFIRSNAAADRGWYVDNVKDALVRSVPGNMWPNGRFNRWDWLQRRLRNNDLAYRQTCNKIEVAHVYYREFPEGDDTYGKISHCIIEVNTKGPRFLYRKLRRFDNWYQVTAPFYYDVGDGTHHSVKGLGIKAFGALESLNRLQCSMVDAAGFGSKVNLQAQTENIRQNAAVVEMGPFTVWPSQFTLIPNFNLGQMLEGPMAVKQDLLNTVTSNLQQYRQGLAREKGNPISATEAAWRAENETTLARTQLTRYFDQCDEFWAERYRRVASTKAIAQECKDFQKRCLDRGVPRKALDNVKHVRATRTVGYGSAYNRLQALNRMLQMIALIPETGRQKVLEDLTSAYVGQSLMRRYIPEQPNAASDDRTVAALQVAAAKVGVPPVMPEDVDHQIFAVTFMQAIEQALGSLEQGANPMDVLGFVEMLAPAMIAHIQAMMTNPTQKENAKALEKRANEIASLVDKLRAQVQQMMQQQAEQAQVARQAQAVQAGQDPELQLKAAETKAKLDMKAVSTRHQMALKQAKANQDLRLKEMAAVAEQARADAAKESQSAKE